MERTMKIWAARLLLVSAAAPVVEDVVDEVGVPAPGEIGWI
jgi:hypothetical protein